MAKLHAIVGAKLRDSDYHQLMSCSNVADAADYLKRRTYYSRVLENTDTDKIHRGILENLLRRGFYEDCYRITNFEKLGDDEVYNHIVLKTEVDEILICITHINAGTDDQISTIPIYMNRYTCFDLMELAKVRSFSELLKLLAKTPYAALLKKYSPKAGEKINYQACELALRSYFYERLLGSRTAAGDKDIQAYICAQIDMINIINAYRLKKYYYADYEQIKSLMIPIYRRIPERAFDQLYSAVDSEDFIRILRSTFYGRKLDEAELMKSPERALQKERYRSAKRSFALAKSPPAAYLTYVYLAETELKNIIRIIEGIRYSLPVEEIASLLIL
ncbi:MAG: V-type ATPase subunit [Oscillospiraceae bacterium]|nr:V-type ATPase subunit [Oscillospiraceae bacterium]